MSFQYFLKITTSHIYGYLSKGFWSKDSKVWMYYF